MIRTNLISGAWRAKALSGRSPAGALAVILAGQLLYLSGVWNSATMQESVFNKAVSRKAALEKEPGLLTVTESLQELAGRVAARNNWLADKKSSPITRLAALQQDCPAGVALLSFDADLTGGKILLNAPDLNTVSGWLNRHFGGRGSLSVAGRDNNLLTIQFTWSG
ncbi:MAG TPA: hypothetical protein PLK28_09795 [Candidatus Rifleibacterium sp.]|jgi:hypothetical protein|nr:hypothetical protein [Candidatus Rifleibacterium sp.]